MTGEHEAPPGAEQRWVSIAQAARALDLTERAVRGRIDRGTIPCKRETIGNRVRHRVLLTLPRHDPQAEQQRHDRDREREREYAETVAILDRMKALLAEKDLRIADLQREAERLGRLAEHAMERLAEQQAERQIERQAEQPPARRWRWWRRAQS